MVTTMAATVVLARDQRFSIPDRLIFTGVRIGRSKVEMSGFETAQLSDLMREDGWAPIRKFFGIQSFGINAWTAHEAGGTLIPKHDERPSGHEELYLVIDGHATFMVNGEALAAPVGTLVFVRDPAVARGAVAAEPGTTVVSLGAVPGQAYAPRSWETNRDVFALLDAGDAAAAKRVLTEALDRYSDPGALLYNLACAETQLGETDAALDHLRAALREDRSLAESARHDADLEPLRSDSRFLELIEPA
jgi:tetratricopeptide (TPR) repeat protein